MALSLSIQLRNKILKSVGCGGRIPRGAATRVAEACGVSPATAKRWIDGDFEPSIHLQGRVREVISGKGMDFSARKSGPKRAE